MKHLALLLFLACMLTGCLEVEILIKVKPDGSGTVQKTFLMSSAAVQQMKQMAEQFGPAGSENTNFDLVDRQKLSDEAETMGQGVQFSHVSRLFTRDKEGYTAYYTFKDINTLSINQNQSTKALPGTGNSQTPSKSEPLTFYFERGTPSQLVIVEPDQSESLGAGKAESLSQNSEINDTTNLSSMVGLMKGFKVSIAIQIEGRITKTTATYVDTNQVTLMEIDFERLVRDPQKFAQLIKERPQSAEEIKNALKGTPGMRIELSKRPTIWFEEK